MAKHCPSCKKQGKRTKLKLYNVNSKKAAYMCPKLKCDYPYGYPWTYVQRDLRESDGDSDSASTTSVERDIDEYLRLSEDVTGDTSDSEDYEDELEEIQDLVDKLRDKNRTYSLQDVKAPHSKILREVYDMVSGILADAPPDVTRKRSKRKRALGSRMSGSKCKRRKIEVTRKNLFKKPSVLRLAVDSDSDRSDSSDNEIENILNKKYELEKYSNVDEVCLKNVRKRKCVNNRKTADVLTETSDLQSIVSMKQRNSAVINDGANLIMKNMETPKPSATLNTVRVNNSPKKSPIKSPKAKKSELPVPTQYKPVDSHKFKVPKAIKRNKIFKQPVTKKIKQSQEVLSDDELPNFTEEYMSFSLLSPLPLDAEDTEQSCSAPLKKCVKNSMEMSSDIRKLPENDNYDSGNESYIDLDSEEVILSPENFYADKTTKENTQNDDQSVKPVSESKTIIHTNNKSNVSVLPKSVNNFEDKVHQNIKSFNIETKNIHKETINCNEVELNKPVIMTDNLTGTLTKENNNQTEFNRSVKITNTKLKNTRKINNLKNRLINNKSVKSQNKNSIKSSGLIDNSQKVSDKLVVNENKTVTVTTTEKCNVINESVNDKSAEPSKILDQVEIVPLLSVPVIDISDSLMSTLTKENKTENTEQTSVLINNVPDATEINKQSVKSNELIENLDNFKPTIKNFKTRIGKTIKKVINDESIKAETKENEMLESLDKSVTIEDNSVNLISTLTEENKTEKFAENVQNFILNESDKTEINKNIINSTELTENKSSKSVPVIDISDNFNSVLLEKSNTTMKDKDVNSTLIDNKSDKIETKSIEIADNLEKRADDFTSTLTKDKKNEGEIATENNEKNYISIKEFDKTENKNLTHSKKETENLNETGYNLMSTLTQETSKKINECDKLTIDPIQNKTVDLIHSNSADESAEKPQPNLLGEISISYSLDANQEKIEQKINIVPANVAVVKPMQTVKATKAVETISVSGSDTDEDDVTLTRAYLSNLGSDANESNNKKTRFSLEPSARPKLSPNRRHCLPLSILQRTLRSTKPAADNGKLTVSCFTKPPVKTRAPSKKVVLNSKFCLPKSSAPPKKNFSSFAFNTDKNKSCDSANTEVAKTNGDADSLESDLNSIIDSFDMNTDNMQNTSEIDSIIQSIIA